jgi:hypothetical protein
MPDKGGANGRNHAPISTATAVRTPSDRGTLGRELIIAEAVRFIDPRGQDRLTMRRLGGELNVEAMALIAMCQAASSCSMRWSSM